MLWQRLLFGTLMVAAVVGIVAVDACVSAPGTGEIVPGRLAALPITLLALLLVVLAAFEMGRLCQAGGHQPATAWAAFVAAGLVLVPWIEMHEQLGRLGALFSPAVHQVSPTVIWLAGGALGTCLAILMRRTTDRALSNIAVTILLFVYLGLLGSFLVRIRCLAPGPAGALVLIYAVLTVKAGDIGAYFTGLLFGRHKLAPWLSPGKTVEGAAGAIVLAMAVAAGGVLVWPAGLAVPFTPLQALGFGALMAVVGHLGDLVESAFKRDMKIKDSGRLVPAFGGLLDLLDSPLFAAPVAWLAMTLRAGIDYN
ncbi:MAG TPA: phosphatidate cytidylyltransferase [Phycisphaerae bacterium]|nr:phosphatidate cytidylyltransferase [Phycisphaerae bacterium]